MNSPSLETHRFVLLRLYQSCCILPNFLHMRIQCPRVHLEILCWQPTQLFIVTITFHQHDQTDAKTSLAALSLYI
jgi:hypothetical protein